MTTPLPPVHLHADWLAVFVYKVQLVRAATARGFARFDLRKAGEDRLDLLRWDGGRSEAGAIASAAPWESGLHPEVRLTLGF